MGAEYLSYVKFIANEAPTFFGYIISVLASVLNKTHNIKVRLQFGNSPLKREKVVTYMNFRVWPCGRSGDL